METRGLGRWSVVAALGAWLAFLAVVIWGPVNLGPSVTVMYPKEPLPNPGPNDDEACGVYRPKQNGSVTVVEVRRVNDPVNGDRYTAKGWLEGDPTVTATASWSAADAKTNKDMASTFAFSIHHRLYDRRNK